MVAQAVAGQNGGVAAPQPEAPGIGEIVMQVVVMVCALQFLSSVSNSFFGTNSNDAASIMNDTAIPIISANNSRKPLGVDPLSVQKSSKAKNYVLLWPPGSIMNLAVFVNTQPKMTLTEYHKLSKKIDTKTTLGFWQEENLLLTKGKTVENSRNKTITIPITSAFWNNQTALYAHAFLTQQIIKEKTINKEGLDEKILYKVLNLTTFRTRRKEKIERSLLQDQLDPEREAEKFAALRVSRDDKSVLGMAAKNFDEDVTLMYIKPTLTLQLVDDLPPYFPKSSLPPQMKDHMDFYVRDVDDIIGYYPILHGSEFWMRKDDLIAVNETLKEVTLDLSVYPIRMWKWQLMSQMETTWRTQDETGQSDGASDMMRTVLMDTNPWLLGLTMVVSLLHTIFDILAFKNDITFFKGKKSMEGISLRSMFVNTAFQLIILLYLIDNETSFMVLVSNAVGVAIEVWKISKAVKISVKDGKLNWEEDKTYKSTKTKEYDEIATNHLLFVTMPLVAGYGVYSLFHQKHKGWYSWILNTLVGFIYMFGFVMMTPQLFINYKLQSVAHLNWRTMTYKSINTFIDDLFAFIIKMPIMHRLACLRDDLVFFIFLYQRWAYRVDYTRVNEFGQCAVPTEDMIAEVASKEITTNISVTSQNITTEANNIRQRRGAREKRQ